jgi:hypothetical protein
MQRWEYTSIVESVSVRASLGSRKSRRLAFWKPDNSTSEAVQYVETCSAQLGLDGWELVGVSNVSGGYGGATTYFFKRPLEG